jgi:hypothetical protein
MLLPVFFLKLILILVAAGFEASPFSRVVRNVPGVLHEVVVRPVDGEVVAMFVVFIVGDVNTICKVVGPIVIMIVIVFIKFGYVEDALWIQTLIPILFGNMHIF